MKTKKKNLNNASGDERRRASGVGGGRALYLAVNERGRNGGGEKGKEEEKEEKTKKNMWPLFSMETHVGNKLFSHDAIFPFFRKQLSSSALVFYIQQTGVPFSAAPDLPACHLPTRSHMTSFCVV